MPTKRSKAKPRRGRITEADAAAFIAGDRSAFSRALGLRPWEFTISPTEEEAREQGWSVEKIMDHREQIEAELLDWENDRWVAP